ncbi:hypothetical protein GX50_03650 [[Emmonsia] crescens]|uniref:Uncharacterized protein n=1 Tax=[Emmonsia] crescens TaxID=73230 RepID=A0A2B7ZAN0_9EURO|nr:hypothetical protein GX50_03650 [Emmonsia crescens]
MGTALEVPEFHTWLPFRVGGTATPRVAKLFAANKGEGLILFLLLLPLPSVAWMQICHGEVQAARAQREAAVLLEAGVEVRLGPNMPLKRRARSLKSFTA